MHRMTCRIVRPSHRDVRAFPETWLLPEHPPPVSLPLVRNVSNRQSLPKLRVT